MTPAPCAIHAPLPLTASGQETPVLPQPQPQPDQSQQVPQFAPDELRGILSAIQQLTAAEAKIAKLEEMVANSGDQGSAYKDQVAALKQMIEILQTVITAQAQALATDLIIIARYKQQLAESETYWKGRRDDEVAHWKEIVDTLQKQLKDERSQGTWNEVWGWIRTILGIGVTAAIMS